MHGNTADYLCGRGRRSFLKGTGKKALWAAPLATVIMTASSQRAKAGFAAYKCDYNQ